MSDNQAIKILVFTAGSVVMGVEIVASRLFTPYYGDTVYVWGSLIAVIMTALAIGYRRGGKKADQYTSYIELSNIILVAGIFVIMIPTSAPLVIETVRLLRIPMIYEPLLPSAILLSIPTICLGMVSPYALKLSTKNLRDVGKTSGDLSSINTAGGIVGTFLTVFYLIPSFGTREIIIGLGTTLVAVSIIGRARPYLILVIIFMVILLVPRNVYLGELRVLGSGVLVFSAETPYSSLSVVDNKLENTRTLFLQNRPHSAMYINGSAKPVYKYTDFFNLAFGYNPNITRVLFIGGGGFSAPKQFLVDYPWVFVDVVEIDPVVVDVAYTFFNVPQNHSRLGVFIKDGRKFLIESGMYDLIVLDAYSHNYAPFHLMTNEFMSLAVQHLNEGGVLVSNLIGSTVGDTSELLWSEVLTVRLSMPYISLFRTRDYPESMVQNIIMVACFGDVSGEEVLVNLERSGVKSRHFGFFGSRYVGQFPEDGLILRDNFAPVVDLLDPVTLNKYDREGGLNLQSVLSPFFIAGFWMVSLVGLLLLSKMLD